MTAPQDNPAGRLHWVLTELKERHPNEKIEVALAAVLDIEESADDAGLHEYVAAMARWPGAAREQIEALPDENHALLLQWTDHVDAAMKWAGRWAHTINNMVSQYNDTTLYSLAITADLLHRRCPEPTIADDALEGLVALVRDIIDGVVADENLPSLARQFLLAHLHEVERALLHFRIVGYPGVEEAMNRLVGGAVRRPDTHEQAGSWINNLWARIQSALAGTKQIADTGQSVVAAIEAGTKLMSG